MRQLILIVAGLGLVLGLTMVADSKAQEPEVTMLQPGEIHCVAGVVRVVDSVEVASEQWDAGTSCEGLLP